MSSADSLEIGGAAQTPPCSNHPVSGSRCGVRSDLAKPCVSRKPQAVGGKRNRSRIKCNRSRAGQWPSAYITLRRRGTWPFPPKGHRHVGRFPSAGSLRPGRSDICMNAPSTDGLIADTRSVLAAAPVVDRVGNQSLSVSGPSSCTDTHSTSANGGRRGIGGVQRLRDRRAHRSLRAERHPHARGGSGRDRPIEEGWPQWTLTG
jgi:hypothetical protein